MIGAIIGGVASLAGSLFGGGKARRPKSSTTTTERPTRGTTTRFPGQGCIASNNFIKLSKYNGECLSMAITEFVELGC